MVDWNEQPIPLERGHLDLRRGAIDRDGERIALTTKEVELLRYLVERASTDVPREDLLTDVWGYAATAMTRAVDTAVKRLRKKLELNPAEPRHLLSVHGVGYRFEPADQAFAAPPPSAPPRELTPDLPAQDVPTDGDRFVGRSEEWAAIDAAFATGRRLVTLRGPAGVGKSRLAREFARASDQAVAWIALGGIGPDALRATLAAGLGAGREDDRALVEAIGARGDLLLVLDDADAVLADVASQTRPVLGACPNLRVLVTARAALELPEEERVAIEPLRRGDAIALFLDRARGSLDPEDPELGGLIDDLDRLPLAIELAAPRARVLSPADLRRRLQQRFKVLSRRRGAPGQGLEEAIAWSWEQLDPEERGVLEACSVFQGGFSVEAAEEVATLDDDSVWVIDVLESLEAKSMLHRRSLPGGGARLELLRSVQDFVVAGAEADVLESARSRHRGVFVELGERLLAALHGPDVAGASAEMGVERRNLVAAWRTATGEERARLAIVLGTQGMHASTVEEVRTILEQTEPTGLSPAVEARLRVARAAIHRATNQFEAARTEASRAADIAEVGSEAWMDAERLKAGLRADGGDIAAALEHLAVARGKAPTDPSPARLRMLAREALLRFHHGQVDASGDLIEELLRGALVRRSPWHENEAHRLRAGLRLRRSQLDDAIRDGRHALDGFTALGDRWRRALCLELLGAIASFQGDHEGAEERHGAAVTLYRQMGRRHELPRALGNLSRALVHQRRIPEARECAEQALAAAREHGEWRAIEESAMLGGTIALAEDRWEEAEAHFQQGIEQAEAVGEAGVAAIARAARAFALMLQGRPDEAREENAAARAVFDDAGDRLSGTFHTAIGAAIAADQGDAATAAALMDRAEANRPPKAHRELGLWMDICAALVGERTPAAAASIRARLESESASAYVRALAGHLFRAVQG